MKIADYLYPSLLVSENLFAIVGQEEILFRKVESILEDGFYKKMEIGAIENSDVRKRFLRLTEELNIEWVQWLTSDINRLGLNPSTTDKDLRDKTIRELIRLAQEAAQSGANHIALIGGPAPSKELCEEAVKGLSEVLCIVSEYISQYPGMKLYLEPLDCEAHKKNLIGRTPEAVALMKTINCHHDNCRIGWDSAHVALNKEDFEESLQMCKALLGQIHIANAVTDPTSKLYGDWHMPIGNGGVINSKTAIQLAKAACNVENCTYPISVAVETRCAEEAKIDARVAYNRHFLTEILNTEL